MISRVTVDFPFVPEIDTTGTRRSASRIQAGGEVRASAMRSDQRATVRSWAPVRRAVRDGDTSRSARAKAASVSSRARSSPVHGNVMIQCPGSDERWTASPARPSPWSTRSRRIQATIAATPSGQSRAGTLAPRWTSSVAARVALAVPGPPPADGDLQLDHRLEPVDVGALEESDLDQSHGPGRIPSAHARAGHPTAPGAGPHRSRRRRPAA